MADDSVSVTSAPVTPEALAEKQDLPFEPIQPDRASVPAKSPEPSSDRSDVVRTTTPMMRGSHPAEASEPSFDDVDLEQSSMPMMTHSVQVGAFRRMENAENLIGRLEIKGYSAYVLEISDAKDRLWFTVRIGDHSTLESAEEQARIFMVQENMKAFVRPYNAF